MSKRVKKIRKAIERKCKKRPYECEECPLIDDYQYDFCYYQNIGKNINEIKKRLGMK